MKVVVLAGGQGSRLGALTRDRPKALVEIGGTPILWHVLSIFARAGHDEVLVAAGRGSEMIARRAAADRPVANIHVINTGPDTPTASRLARLRDHLDDEPFFMAWTDGLTDADPNALLAHHGAHARVATVLAVRPPERFGRLELDGDRVTAFHEKRPSGWISGGLFVLEPRVFEEVSDKACESWEQGAMPRLVAAGEMTAYCHEGFWACMDHPSEREALDTLWRSGRAPWRA